MGMVIVLLIIIMGLRSVSSAIKHYYTPKCLISYIYTTALFSVKFFLFISHEKRKDKQIEKHNMCR